MMTAEATSTVTITFRFVLFLLGTDVAKAAGSVCRTYSGPVPNNYVCTWQIPLNPSGKSANFDVKVSSDFWVFLSTDNTLLQTPLTSARQVGFGDNYNTRCNIGPWLATYYGTVLDANNAVPLWLSWADGIIAAGKGKRVGDNTLVSFVDSSTDPVNYLQICGYKSLGTVDITYCYDPLIHDHVFPIDTPDVITTLSTMLDCGRLCVEDLKCEGYAVARDVPLVGNTDCYIFYSITGLQLDPHHVSYVSGNGTLGTI